MLSPNTAHALLQSLWHYDIFRNVTFSTPAPLTRATCSKITIRMQQLQEKASSGFKPADSEVGGMERGGEAKD